MDMHLPGYHEDGFEADALLSYVALGTRLGTLTDGTNRFEVLGAETILVAFQDDSVGKDLIGHEWCGA